MPESNKGEQCGRARRRAEGRAGAAGMRVGWRRLEEAIEHEGVVNHVGR
jgi:hypothetical protein